MRRVAAVAALVVALLTGAAGVALAESPLRVDGQITDKAAALREAAGLGTRSAVEA